MAPLIRLTLLALYLALVLPLPWQAPAALQPALWAAVVLGLGLVLALTSERVEVDADGIRVGHPAWCAWWLRRGWQLPWQAITAITPVTTSQGGRVFYLRSGDGSFLLPQRVARFEAFLERLSRETGLDTSGIGRISPPWTYRLLATLSALMLAGELGWGLTLLGS
ncbi:hypothetical protein [Cyanobium sp. CH-040]|uniref:hypothetical protein n=1 Tax=Cyanobium sp. CH-040 TaxID=2823708 RepID=UPI0020CE2BBD|nr:hypothetical protein [Cyanobium sp. CH-040]MCP9927652.1 hypothetical protein [Cyanobium sp. CH-040]